MSFATFSSEWKTVSQQFNKYNRVEESKTIWDLPEDKFECDVAGSPLFTRFSFYSSLPFLLLFALFYLQFANQLSTEFEAKALKERGATEDSLHFEYLFHKEADEKLKANRVSIVSCRIPFKGKEENNARKCACKFV